MSWKPPFSSDGDEGKTDDLQTLHNAAMVLEEFLPPPSSRLSNEEKVALADEILARNSASPRPDVSASDLYDPIAEAMAQHPGLTREKAEEMAEAFGF